MGGRQVFFASRILTASREVFAYQTDVHINNLLINCGVWTGSCLHGGNYTTLFPLRQSWNRPVLHLQLWCFLLRETWEEVLKSDLQTLDFTSHQMTTRRVRAAEVHSTDGDLGWKVCQHQADNTSEKPAWCIIMVKSDGLVILRWTLYQNWTQVMKKHFRCFCWNWDSEFPSESQEGWLKLDMAGYFSLIVTYN